MSIKERADKIDSFIVAVLQYAYLIFYLNYSNAIISSQIIMIGIAIILLTVVFARFVFFGGKFSLCLMTAAFGSVFGVFCAILNGSGLGSAVTQASLLLSLSFLSETKLSKRDYKRAMLRMAVVLVAIMLVFSRRDTYNVYYLPIFGYFDSTLKINPNCMAMLWFFLLVYVYKYIELCELSSRLRILLYTASAIICLAGIWSSGARTSMISAALFVAFCLLCKNPDFGRLHRKYLWCLILSLALAFIYVGLYNVGFLKDVTVFGKSLYSGRQSVWSEGIELLKTNFLIGFSNKTAFSDKELLSLHNSLLASLCYYGIIVFVCNVAVMLMAFKRICRAQNRYAAFAVMCAVFIMTFETLTTDWSLMWPLCILFTCYSDQEEEGEMLYDT